MSVSNVLAMGRRATESRMRDECVIKRPGKKTSDGRGGETVEMSTIYEGKCYTRYPGLAFESNRDLVGVTVVESRVLVRVPFGPVFRPDDVVEITASSDTPHLVGTVLRVASIDDQSQATAQRLLCDDFQKGVSNEQD